MENKNFGLDLLQPVENPQNHQDIVWKSLAKKGLDLEMLGKSLEDPYTEFSFVDCGCVADTGLVQAFERREATTAPPTISAQAIPNDGVAGAKPATTRISVESTGAA